MKSITMAGIKRTWAGVSRGLLVGIFLATAALGVHADDKQASVEVRTQQVQPNEADLQTHKHYLNKDKQEVHSPSKSKSGEVPAGASARCRDGSYSFSTHHRGTCSHHGGVGTWLQ
ncbi:DUF3761 domain-containing protein [Collimonas silvisoli]|uniref:DUF3761 domain-containing protein n=1 Tax=Collimonas silvisoli TaxID=2825884 RepID=UPI001E39260F|nr:DUF3761 domain-containing protein [Collimonas silvisoli]